MNQMREPSPEVFDDGLLDSYSETVMRVAETVTPRVAAMEMTSTRRNGRFRMGAGFAVLFSEDGYLLTNSHVVAGTSRGHAAFADGSRTDLELVGVDSLSDLAVVRGKGLRGALPGSAMPRHCVLASWLSQSGIRSGWQDRSRPEWSAAWAVPSRSGRAATGG